MQADSILDAKPIISHETVLFPLFGHSMKPVVESRQLKTDWRLTLGPQHMGRIYHLAYEGDREQTPTYQSQQYCRL